MTRRSRTSSDQGRNCPATRPSRWWRTRGSSIARYRLVPGKPLACKGMSSMTTTTLTKGLKGLLPGLALTGAMLGATLFDGGTGTAHAHTDSEAHYLFQLNELQVPGSDQSKLNLGNEVCAALR